MYILLGCNPWHFAYIYLANVNFGEAPKRNEKNYTLGVCAQ